MNKIVLLAVSLALTAGIIGCSKEEKQEAKEEALGVKVEEVTKADLKRKVQITGETFALNNVNIQPKLSGVLQKLRLPNNDPLKIGDRVEKGQVLAVIEHAAQSAALEAAKASLAQAQTHAQPDVIQATIQEAKATADAARAQLAELETNIQNLKKENDRMDQLLKEGTVTEQQYDKAHTAYMAALDKKQAVRAQVERAEAAYKLAQAQTSQLAQAAVDQARAAVAQAQAVVDDATVSAPITGYVTMLPVDEGDMVTPGMLLMQIVAMDTVKIIGGASERYIPYLMPGKTQIVVKTDAYPDRQFEGTLFRVGPSIDRATRTIEVEVRLQNDEHLLKPGMFARMTVILEQHDNVPFIPETALLHKGEDSFVYTVSDSAAHRRPLTLGIRDGERIEVLNGLSAGEQVVVRGQQMVTDGASVNIIPDDESDYNLTPDQSADTEEKP